LKLRRKPARESPISILSVKEDDILNKYTIVISLKNGKTLELINPLKNSIKITFSIDPTKPGRVLKIKYKDHLLSNS
jgi:hypothetical protein